MMDREKRSETSAWTLGELQREGETAPARGIVWISYRLSGWFG